MKELSAYLCHPHARVKAIARRLGVLNETRPKGIGPRNPMSWLTPTGASKVMAIVRAEQGKVYWEGKDFHAEMAKKAEGNRLYHQSRQKPRTTERRRPGPAQSAPDRPEKPALPYSTHRVFHR